MESMIIQSVFEQHMPIPLQFTCEGKNVSPPLKFLNVPKEAKSLVLIMDDPDAPRGVFDHWIVWNIPSELNQLSEGGKELFYPSSLVKQGLNGFQKVEYQGPCPPPGKPHHYFFKLYALDALLELKEGASKAEVEQAMQGHVLNQAKLVGIYQREKS